MAGKTPQPNVDRIVQDPKVLFGKPTIRGTRIPVELVLEHLAYNLDLGDLFAAYPHLSTEDVKSCLAYARRAVGRGSRKNVTANLRTAISQSSG